MRIVLQRVASARVEVATETVGAIGPGAVLLVGVEREDDEATVAAALDKVVGLRVFEDPEGRMNLDASQSGAAFLVVSQFTLAASTRKGRRPSFDAAMPPDDAEPLVDRLVEGLRARGFEVATGRFGAYMQVALVNDGPVTFVLDF